jgi:hypothetical protein
LGRAIGAGQIDVVLKVWVDTRGFQVKPFPRAFAGFQHLSEVVCIDLPQDDLHVHSGFLTLFGLGSAMAAAFLLARFARHSVQVQAGT